MGVAGAGGATGAGGVAAHAAMARHDAALGRHAGMCVLRVMARPSRCRSRRCDGTVVAVGQAASGVRF